MKNLGRLPKLESNRSEMDYAILEVIIGVILLTIVVFSVYIMVAYQGISRMKALDNCLNSGKGKSYCEMMLN